MSLRSIPLRLKLVAALVLPMLVVAGYLGLDTRASLAERAEATEQRAEVERFVAVAGFSDAIGVENLVGIDREATAADLAAARAETDAVMELLRSSDLGLDAAILATLEERFDELQALRASLGDEPFEIRLNAQSELRSGDLTMTGDVLPALASLSALPSAVLADFPFDASIGDAATAALLDDYFLVQRYRADLGREVTTLLRVSSLPANLIDAEITELVGTSITATDQSRQALLDLGSPGLVESVAPVLSGPALQQYETFREVVDAAEIGVRPEVDLEQLQSSGAELDFAFKGVGDSAIDELNDRASGTVFQTTRDLVISALVGFWLIVLVSLLLRLLYRAIKSPIERLTERAQQVSLIELPEVVAQMRRGEIEDIPTVDDLAAESNDEIGALVEAFNDMHRTAVELAAEQASSRRVVADMFVNLGRRNQRLVNRLLKGLTVLEQHEQDPDKLASLYEIDHVATRMRRNAESLLVLAGADQSRRWNRPVPLFDIARASLAEVENYERVQIDVAEDYHIEGGAVADLTHLLAEIVENALSFSPPTSPVEVVARPTEGGLLIAISDNGVGMTPERLAEANRQIHEAAGEDETPSEFLGHYVVGRLAVRHGIRVVLLEGPAGGVSARITLPASMVRSSPDEIAPDPTPAAAPESGSVDAALASLASRPEPSEVRAPVASSAYAATAEPSLAEQMPRRIPQEESAPVAASLAEQAPRRREEEPAPIATSLADQAPRRRQEEPAPVASSLAEQAPRRVAQDPPAAAESLAEQTPRRRPAPVETPDHDSVESLFQGVSRADEAAATRTEPTPGSPNPASFEWPSPSEVDPLAQERRPAPTPRPEPSEASGAAPVGSAPLAGTSPADTAIPSPPVTPLQPSSDSTSELERAADAAVAGALSVFGAAPRMPGAQLPDTDLLAAISGSMHLGSPDDTPPAPRPEAPADGLNDLGDADRVRFDLSGFQQGTTRADREMGDNQ